MTRDINRLPIGTVVLLHESTAAVMIAGYLAESDKKPGYIWDYSGFLYPIGLRDEKEVYTFDQSQIREIFALGYQDGESFAFMHHLGEVAEEIARHEAHLTEETEGKSEAGKENEENV